MSEETTDTLKTGELPPIDSVVHIPAAPTEPAVKKYAVAIEKPKDDPQNRSALAFDDWRGSKGDILPDKIVAALKAKNAVGAVENALEHWLHIGWITEV